jgi:lysylphosphatidylglycerol synthetase-like protein (DUF2156 family)
MLAWSVLSVLLLVALVIIGLRRWEGWMFASIINLGWIVYALVDGVRVVELVIHALALVVTVIFWLRWNREQKVLDEQAGERTSASVPG